MRALKNIRVLDLGGFVTGPGTASLLADFGADTIKIENPKSGDPFRALRSDLYSPQFQYLNNNKRSLGLDYTRPEGRAVLEALARTADVIIVNSRPGVVEKLGISYNAMHKLNPRIIYCSITGFGNDGPYSRRPAFDQVGQALSGWTSRFRQDDDPRVLGPVIIDRVTTYYAAIGVLAALHERTHSGIGRLVETNMLEAAIAWGIDPIAQIFSTNQPVSLYYRAAGSQAYNLACADGKRIGLHLSSPDKFWRALCKAVEREDWIDRYPGHRDRIEHYDDLAKELAATFRTKTRADWMERLDKEDVPFAPENEPQDVELDPQVRHLDVFYTLTHPRHGTNKFARRPIYIDSDRDIGGGPPPALGEHTDQILQEIGFEANDIQHLRELNII